MQNTFSNYNAIDFSSEHENSMQAACDHVRRSSDELTEYAQFRQHDLLIECFYASNDNDDRAHFVTIEKGRDDMQALNDHTLRDRSAYECISIHAFDDLMDAYCFAANFAMLRARRIDVNDFFGV
jgi:predicted solute-binding protein